MPFSEDIKLAVKRKSHFKCCLCHALGVEIHHIVPQSEGGQDTADNAAPLCPSCHETYGGNSRKQKFIREARDFWYEHCERRYAADPEYLKSLKQMEDGLAEIKKDVRALHAPLLPCGLFITLCFEATDTDIERLFKDEAGYHAYDSDQMMPPPPIGLPPGMTDGRVLQQGGYRDYLNGKINAAGFFKMDHPGYNVIHRKVSHTISSLSPQVIAKAKARNNPLLAQPSVTVELYFGKSTKLGNESASLILESVFNTHEIAATYALDNSVFVDHALILAMKPADQAQNWSITDLKISHIIVTLHFFYIEPISTLPKESWPTLHNLQLWLGPRADKLLSFSPMQLSSQIVREDPNPIAIGQAKCIQVQFEYDINETVYADNLITSG